MKRVKISGPNLAWSHLCWYWFVFIIYKVMNYHAYMLPKKNHGRPFFPLYLVLVAWISKYIVDWVAIFYYRIDIVKSHHQESDFGMCWLQGFKNQTQGLTQFPLVRAYSTKFNQGAPQSPLAFKNIKKKKKKNI